MGLKLKLAGSRVESVQASRRQAALHVYAYLFSDVIITEYLFTARETSAQTRLRLLLLGSARLKPRSLDLSPSLLEEVGVRGTEFSGQPPLTVLNPLGLGEGGGGDDGGDDPRDSDFRFSIGDG